MKNKIYTSIVLCTLNGEQKLEKTIQSLLNQSIPRGKYEIIVVNDGSTDETAHILEKSGITSITHTKTKGLAASRNTGLHKSRGEIIVCFDDDCIADYYWLENLLTPFTDPNVMGVGSAILPASNPTLTDSYCYDMGYGNPLPIELSRATSFIGRLFAYVSINVTNPRSKYIAGTKVAELPGASASFRVSLVSKIGGWNEVYVNNAEDIDLCNRLKREYPKYYFVSSPNAKIVHEHNLNFIEFIKKEFKRGGLRVLYYKSIKKTPPYFPGPILLAIIASIAIYMNQWVVILALPYFLYPWWFIRAYNERSIRMLIYPYLQLIHEGATVLGMLLIKK